MGETRPKENGRRARREKSFASMVGLAMRLRVREVKEPHSININIQLLLRHASCACLFNFSQAARADVFNNPNGGAIGVNGIC